MTEARGPLAGVRIVDMTAMLAGPWATMILGDQGADVIKIEAPGVGDHTRATDGDTPSPGFLNLNRSKRSVALDLKTPRGRELLLALAKTADVAVQNFRPGVVDRLGVGYDAVCAARPDIVYVSISGFGTEGPYAAQRVYDPVIQGLSGLTTIQAGSDEVRPRLVRTVLPDKLTAMTAAQAISSALYARAQSGRGQHIRLSMLDAVLQFLWASDMGQQTLPDREPAPQRPASRIDLIYRTRDGHITLGANTDKEWAGPRARARQAGTDPRSAVRNAGGAPAQYRRSACARAGASAGRQQRALAGDLARQRGAVRTYADAQRSDRAPADRGKRQPDRIRPPPGRAAASDPFGGALRRHAPHRPARCSGTRRRYGFGTCGDRRFERRDRRAAGCRRDRRRRDATGRRRNSPRRR